MGLEPTTSAMARRRSSQLSYVCIYGAGGQVRTGTSKGWSLSALTHLSYPRTHMMAIIRKFWVFQIFYDNHSVLYLVRKPLWITSNLVVKILKRVLKVDKIGFAGTLDPLASGLMIIGIDWSTRLFPMIEHFQKTYTTTIRLDGTTASYDLEKPIETIEISKDVIQKITLEGLQEIVKENFIGDILQAPPLYSAIWIDGKRSYERMRKGEIGLELEAKPRTIHNFEILSYTWPQISCRITVSHGTYIRSIARDIGELLWTGGYLETLERTSLWHISLDSPREWIQHNDIFYIPFSHEELFPNIPVITLSEEEKSHLRIGSTPLQSILSDGQYFIKYDEVTYGLLEVKNGMVFPVKNWI